MAVLEFVYVIRVTPSPSTNTKGRIQLIFTLNLDTLNSMATRLGSYPFNADICILNTDISINKYVYLFFVITDISN